MTARHFAGVILAAVAISIAAERHRHARLLRRTRIINFLSSDAISPARL
jgi:hypothetical protein